MQVMGRDELIGDARFVDNPSRVANIDAIDAEIAGWTRKLLPEEVLEKLAEAGIPSCKIYSAADIVQDAQYQARGAVRAVPDPVFGEEILQPGPVPRFTGGPAENIAWAGPTIGAHNAEIYGSVLNLSEDQIADLSGRNVI